MSTDDIDDVFTAEPYESTEERSALDLFRATVAYEVRRARASGISLAEISETFDLVVSEAGA